MFITTTEKIEGYIVTEYLGLVSGEVINGINFVKDFAASITNILGGRSRNYEEELIDAKENAIKELQNRAEKIGANAIIGIKINYETFGSNNGMVMVSVLGTAVKIIKK